MRCINMLKPALVLCYSLLFLAVVADAKTLSLKRAIKSKAILVDAISNGGAMGKCLTLNLLNQLDEPLDITVDPGMIFVPSDTSFQNLVAVGGEVIALKPKERAPLSVQTFCGKSYAHGPVRGLQYNFWKQGDSIMIKVSNYITSHQLYNNIGQHAIWTLTNNHPISTIYSPAMVDESKEFISYIAKLRNIPEPEYYTHYELDNRPGAVSPIIYSSGKQYVDVSWKHDEGYRHMYVTIYKENGDVYKQVTGNEVIDEDGHVVNIVFDPTVDLPGTYRWNYMMTPITCGYERR